MSNQLCLVFPISEVNDGTAVDIFSFGMCALEVLSTLLIASALGSTPSHHFQFVPCTQMAVLEIQANGDTRVTEEAIARARHSLSDPNMRVSSLTPLGLAAGLGLALEAL